MSDASARFPQELFDNIIDLVYPNGQTLSSFSLVSRSWLERSRRRKFASIYIGGVREDFRPFLRFITANNNKSLQHPPVSEYIQHVRVENRGQDEGETIDTNMLRSMVSLLPNLRDIAFLGIALEYVTPKVDDTRDGSTFRPAHLNSLDLSAIKTVSRSPLDIVASLCPFASIKDLRIKTLFTESLPQDPTVISTHPSLSTDKAHFPSKLQVSAIRSPDSHHTPFILALIARTASVETINEVDVACLTRLQINALGSFLGIVGVRVKKITLHINKFFESSRGEPPSFDLLQAYNLSVCTNLTDLTVRIPISPYGDMSIVFQVITILLSLSAATVQTVILEILIYQPYRPGRDRDTFLLSIGKNVRVGFAHLQSTIKQREGIRKLCIRWGHVENHVRLAGEIVEGMSGIARSQLSELDASGILCFESIDI